MSATIVKYVKERTKLFHVCAQRLFFSVFNFIFSRLCARLERPQLNPNHARLKLQFCHVPHISWILGIFLNELINL